MKKLENLNSLITEAVRNRHKPKVVEISSLRQLMEMSTIAKKEKKEVRKELKTEMMLRQHIRKKIQENLAREKQQEFALRKLIRTMLMEGDVSDVHPHRSTGINVLEDVLKKSIPTLRADYKRLTTDKQQRDSFRAHIVKAVEDQLKPSLVNDKYPLEAPTPDPTGGNEKPSDRVNQDVDAAFTSNMDAGGESPENMETDELADELAALEEADISIDVEPEQEEEKFAAVEDDDGPTDEEAFGKGLEGLDETGRNMAYTSFRKISQYILDAYDTLANMEDKNVFVDYLVTNLKLYFDKFEAELSQMVVEPTTDQYQQSSPV